jgi:hypothetical protein
MVRAIFIYDLDSVVDLVLLQADVIDLCFYLDAGNAAEAEAGSVNELCLEVCLAHVPAEFDGRRAVEISGRRVAALGNMFSDINWSLCGVGFGRDVPREDQAQELPLCRLIRLGKICLERVLSSRFVSGHGFSRAEKVLGSNGF